MKQEEQSGEQEEKKKDIDQDYPMPNSLSQIEARILSLEDVVAKEQETLKRMMIVLLIYIILLAVIIGKIFVDLL